MKLTNKFLLIILAITVVVLIIDGLYVLSSFKKTPNLSNSSPIPKITPQLKPLDKPTIFWVKTSPINSIDKNMVEKLSTTSGLTTIPNIPAFGNVFAGRLKKSINYLLTLTNSGRDKNVVFVPGSGVRLYIQEKGKTYLVMPFWDELIRFKALDQFLKPGDLVLITKVREKLPDRLNGEYVILFK